MNKLLLLVVPFLSVILLADNHKGSIEKNRNSLMDHPNYLMNFKECKETKDGIAGLLSLSEAVWEEIEMNPENEEKWLEVVLLSDLIGNYSTVYDVWCKDMINKRVQMRMMAAKKKMKAGKKRSDEKTNKDD